MREYICYSLADSVLARALQACVLKRDANANSRILASSHFSRSCVMTVASVVRLIALSLVSVFALCTLGLAAAVLSLSKTYMSGYYPYAALAIAAAVISILTIPAMIALDLIHPGGLTSQIKFELPWLSVLAALWLATASYATKAVIEDFPGFCDEIRDSANRLVACQESAILLAFAHLNYFILFGYLIFILSLCLVAVSRQHAGVWRSSVAQAPFFTRKGAAQSSAHEETRV
ncbi:unnamed protein product [Mycena citricolor]|uniref:MARVEL domain-containing protein n=1 Tax=Mycena citricolor TaxID=2018698 RepID=A0AAD2K409_9AGAR|nr:unnamed protein product [Mycena citricolor]